MNLTILGFLMLFALFFVFRRRINRRKAPDFKAEYEKISTSFDYIRQVKLQMREKGEVDHLPVVFLYYQFKVALLLFYLESGMGKFKKLECELLDSATSKCKVRFFGLDMNDKTFMKDAILGRSGVGWVVERIED